MYETFFGFRERPFDLTANPNFLVATAKHREALSNLVYGLRSRKGLVLLVGEAGVGKTTVIRTVLAQQPPHVHSVYIHNPTLTRSEFLELMAGSFGLSANAARSKAAFLVELEALLQKRHAGGEATVLVFDEAQSLPHELLEEVRLLANLERDETKLLTVILAGQPELAARLNDDSLRQLKQRIALRCELKPLSLNETAAYIAGRISAGGGVGVQVFTREAVTLVHERSRGIPRTISVICDNALLTGFALGQRPITTRIISEVCADFDLTTAAEARPGPVAVPAPAAPAEDPAADARLLSIRHAPAATGQGLRAVHDASALAADASVSDEPSALAAVGNARRRLFRFFGN